MADEPNPFDDYAGDTATLPPPSDTPRAPQGKVPDNGQNPFDAFQDDSVDTLKEAPPPTPAESFVENLTQAAGGLTKQAAATASHVRAQSTVRLGNEKGVASPEGGFQPGKPSQPEYDKALGDIAVQDANRRRWDAFHSEGFWGKTAALVGGAVGGLLDPVNLLPFGATVNSIRGLATAAGVGPVLSNIAANAGAFGLFTAATDAVSQGLDIQAGYQVGWDKQRTLMAGALGAGLGGSISTAAVVIKGLKGELPHQAPKALEGAAKDRELARLGEEERMRTADEAAGKAPPSEPAAGFTTALGSTYEVHGDGTTSRNKAPRSEHPGDAGPQPKSDVTFYVTPEDANKLGEFQTEGATKALIGSPDGTEWAVGYLDGPSAGTLESRTRVRAQNEPAVGLVPVEVWHEGERVHFGNRIVEVRRPEGVPGERGAETPTGAQETEPARTEEPPPPPPDHGFKDVVEDHKERLGPEAPPEQAAHEAFHEEVGTSLETAMRDSGVPPEKLAEMQKHYDRKPGESVQQATDRALDDWIDAEMRAGQAIESKDPVLQRELAEAEPPAAREQPPEDWMPSPDQLAEARRLSRGWSPRPEGQKPKSLIAFVRDNGGLRKDQPEAGDLLSQDIGRQPGLLRTKEAGGRDITEMAERARDAGYDLGPDLDTGNGINAQRFMEMLIEDASARKKHYPAGAETEGHADTQRYNDETNNHLRNRLGVNPKGMDPRQIAWLLEGGHERTGGRLSEEGGGISGGRAAQPGEGQGTARPSNEPVVRGERGGERAAGGEAGTAVAGQRGEGLKTEHTAQGEQTLMPGVEPVTDKARAEAQMAKPLRGGEEAPGGMFDEAALAQHEMFLRGRPAYPHGPNAEFRRRSNREQLPGEAETIVGPKEAVTDAEARDLKLNEQMKHITERLGRRLEFDGRFSVGGVLGTYKPKEGVLRAKYAGDVETWTHELGHAIDQKLATDPQTSAVWSALRTAAPNELLPLDFNAVRSGGKPSIEEGVAEFLRMYVTNPAYAAKQAPLTYGAFKGILNKTPELASILEDAAKLAHTESGLNPVQVFTTMIAQPHVEGLERMSRSVARYGIVPTIKDYAAQVYASVIRENVNFDRFAQALRDAGFQKEGKPLADLTYAKDPNHLYRQMDGAKQSAVAIIDRGVPLNLTDPFNAPRSPGLTGVFARAFNGSYSRIENPNDPLVKAFDGYLVSRRAIGEWDLFEAGELRNQPVRASRSETERAIKDFESQYPNFKQAADDFFSFQRAYTQRMVDKGLWSQEMADKFLAKRSDHIPLYRDFGEDKAGGGARNTKGGGLQFSDVHAFMGSTRDVVSPSRSVMQDIARRERRIAENEVWTALDDLANRAGEVAGPLWEHVPNTEVKGTTVDVEDALRALGKEKGLSPAEIDMMIADLPPMIGQDMTATIFSRQETTPRGERVAFFYRGGKRQTVKMGDNELSKQFFDLMSGMSAPEKDLFMGGVQAVNAAFQASITHAPRFLIGTLIRDNVTRMFFPRAQGILGRVPFAQDLSGIYTMMFDRSFYRAYQEQGGIRGGAYSHAASEISHDAFKAAASSSGMMGRTLDELAAANTFGAKASVVATIPANMVRSSGQYVGSLIDRVRYKEGLPAQGWAVLTTPFKMVSDSLKLMEMGETASRVGNAKLTYNYLKSQGLSDVEAMAGGMYEARDVLNYNSRGSMMTSAPRIFPFLSAAITGADRSARGLIAEPIMAASRAMERGGYANLDPKDKQILAAAWKNWTMIGAVSGVGASMYLPYAQDTEFYKRASKYMRETYWLIQTGEDDEGRPVGLSIHKGYDVSAAIINTIENFSEEARKHDPINWWHVMSGLKEAVPRQFRSTTGLLEAAPGIRTAYEVQTGKKLGFEGGPARPLIPGSMEGLPPDRQVLATTSTFARTLGQQMGVSPIVVDHVLNSSGTGVQDVRDLSSAIFDNNPLLTTKDAMNRFFFGQVYRTARGDAGAGQDLRDIMARNAGEYQKQSNAYRASLEEGDTAEANSIYNRSDDAAKTLMTLQSTVRFDPDARALHPLVRSQVIADNVYSMMRDLGKNQILIQDKAHKRGEPRKVIELSNEQTRQVHAQLNGLLSEETRNGLAIVGHPGYEDFSIIDTKARIEILRKISPEVATEYEARMKTGHVLPAQGVANQWPETKRRLLQDQRAARLADLIPGAKRP